MPCVARSLRTSTLRAVAMTRRPVGCRVGTVSVISYEMTEKGLANLVAGIRCRGRGQCRPACSCGVTLAIAETRDGQADSPGDKHRLRLGLEIRHGDGQW